MTVRKKIFRNTLVNSSGKLLSFALQIFIVTYLIKTLGDRIIRRVRFGAGARCRDKPA